ncbi:YIPF1 [Symbiodinium natans]|uniref:Protein YIPF n=1 Tax=Symbiodinium natans TaxID=878477 RepID=A0A812NUY7_9DINO|nr:YIPF1 [Symbiodinium natans]
MPPASPESFINHGTAVPAACCSMKEGKCVGDGNNSSFMFSGYMQNVVHDRRWKGVLQGEDAQYFHNSATNQTQWEKPEWSTGAPESLSFHSQSSEVYRPTVSDLDLQDRAGGGGGHLVPLSSGHEARGGKLATTEADTVSLRQAPGGVMDSAGPAAGAGGPASSSFSGFGSMLASAAAGSEEGAAGVQGWAGSMLSYAQQMFDISSEDVIKRLKLSLVPFQGLDAASSDLRSRPDFYGPFWVATTAVLFLAATGNFARLLETEEYPAVEFKSDYSLVSVAASMVYGLLVGVPLVTRLGLYCSGQSVDSINFKQVICVYGYSLTPMIPMSVICLVPNSFFRWIAVLAGLGISLAFLWGTLSADLAVEAPSLKWKVLGLFGAAQATIFLVYRVYFFNSMS